MNPLATPCGTTDLGSYIGSSNGCTLGGEFTASGFSFTASAGAPLSASDITVTPTVTTVGGTIVLINFDFAGNFANATSGLLEYTFDYILDPPSPVINGASISLAAGGVLTEDICAGGTFSGGVCNPGTAFFAVLVATVPLPSASTPFPNGVSTVDYHLVLDLQPGDPINGFDSASITGLAAVPEPSVGLLAGPWLLGIIAFRSRAKLRKVFSN